jgi:hypothetical protein
MEGGTGGTGRKPGTEGGDRVGVVGVHDRTESRRVEEEEERKGWWSERRRRRALQESRMELEKLKRDARNEARIANTHLQDWMRLRLSRRLRNL